MSRKYKQYGEFNVTLRFEDAKNLLFIHSVGPIFTSADENSQQRFEIYRFVCLCARSKLIKNYDYRPGNGSAAAPFSFAAFIAVAIKQRIIYVLSAASAHSGPVSIHSLVRSALVRPFHRSARMCVNSALQTVPTAITFAV